MQRDTQTKLLNVGWIVLERGVGVVIAFFVMTLVARHLGPASFGAYAYIFSIAALLMPIALFGMTPIVLRNVGRAPDSKGTIIGSAILLQCLGSAVAITLALLAVQIFGGPVGVTTSLMMFAAVQLIVAPLDSFNSWFRAREQLAWVVIPRIGISLLIAIVAYWLVTRDALMSSFVTLRSIEFALMGIAALAAYAVGTGAVGELRIIRSLFGKLLRDGWPVVLTGIAVVTYTRIDQVMLGHLSSEAELGYYSIAVRVAEIAGVVSIALSTSLFPSIVRAHDRGPTDMMEHMQHVYDVFSLANIGACLVLASGSYFLFVPIFGAAYGPGLPMVLILLLGMPWMGFIQAKGAGLVARGWLWISTVSAAMGAVANIALNVFLIPHFGGVGAAWATLISLLLVAFGPCIIWLRLREDGLAMARSLVLHRSFVRLSSKVFPAKQ